MKQKVRDNQVQYLQVGPDHAGRRIDNYLSGHFKGLPKARIYQMLRKGEVRVNSSRIKQDYRLIAGDNIRIPPVSIKTVKDRGNVPDFLKQTFTNNILYEDNDLIVLNKPSGTSVHGGTNQKYGIIESLRNFQPDYDLLELVHRLDKETSGCLLIAKSHHSLRELHQAIKNGQVEKYYLALLKNRIRKKYIEINLPIKKSNMKNNDRIMQIDSRGKDAMTKFYIDRYYGDLTLARVQLITGRTHQIRVHAAQMGHPVVCDNKYGDRGFNKKLRRTGLKRIFLHAASIKFKLPATGKLITVNAPMPDDLNNFLATYDKQS